MLRQKLVLTVNRLVHRNGFGTSRVTKRRINRAYHWVLNKVKTK